MHIRFQSHISFHTSTLIYVAYLLPTFMPQLLPTSMSTSIPAPIMQSMNKYWNKSSFFVAQLWLLSTTNDGNTYTYSWHPAAGHPVLAIFVKARGFRCRGNSQPSTHLFLTPEKKFQRTIMSHLYRYGDPKPLEIFWTKLTKIVWVRIKNPDNVNMYWWKLYKDRIVYHCLLVAVLPVFYTHVCTQLLCM